MSERHQHLSIHLAGLYRVCLPRNCWNRTSVWRLGASGKIINLRTNKSLFSFTIFWTYLVLVLPRWTDYNTLLDTNRYPFFFAHYILDYAYSTRNRAFMSMWTLVLITIIVRKTKVVVGMALYFFLPGKITILYFVLTYNFFLFLWYLCHMRRYSNITS